MTHLYPLRSAITFAPGCCSMRNCGGRWPRWTVQTKCRGCTDAYSNTVTVATTVPWPTALAR